MPPATRGVGVGERRLSSFLFFLVKKEKASAKRKKLTSNVWGRNSFGKEKKPTSNVWGRKNESLAKKEKPASDVRGTEK